MGTWLPRTHLASVVPEARKRTGLTGDRAPPSVHGASAACPPNGDMHHSPEAACPGTSHNPRHDTNVALGSSLPGPPVERLLGEDVRWSERFGHPGRSGERRSLRYGCDLTGAG